MDKKKWKNGIVDGVENIVPIRVCNKSLWRDLFAASSEGCMDNETF